MSSSIRRWSRKGTQVPTHVLMNGGQLHVPEEDIDAFWNEYVSAIFAGQKLYVVEQKTERFKFFVDLPETVLMEIVNCIILISLEKCRFHLGW